MKILLAYDASTFAKAAISDLSHGGFPSSGVDVKVVTVGEVTAPLEGAMNIEPTVPIVAYSIERAQELAKYALEAAERDAEEAKTIISLAHPRWNVETEAGLGSPASVILEIAKSWQPDVIVMGSHGRSAIGRLFLGSVSMRVASEAACSVRIVKHRTHEGVPVIMLAFDGSEGARNTVHRLMQRTWPAGTKLHIVTVIDVSVLASLDYIWLVGPDLEAHQNMKETRLEHVLHSVECEMKKHFQAVTSSTPVGAPIRELLSEAKRVGATSIFIGSRGLSKMERVLLGSVSHGVIAGAEQSVEIVR